MIVGIDEVGRGCWAGPLVAAAVILHIPIAGLNDSKVLTKKRRDELAVIIKENAEVGIGWVTPREVDDLGLTKAVQLAMQRAIGQVASQYDQVIIDGNYNFLPHIPGSKAIVKADGNIPAVSAASIVAKVARDTYMEKLPEEYALWEFGSHVGYGTTRHSELLKIHGISNIHRKSYKPIKRIIGI